MDSGTPVSRWFSRILVCLIVLTFACLALMVYIGIAIPKPTDSQKTLIDTLSHVFTGCVGTLIGLVGGKLS